MSLTAQTVFCLMILNLAGWSIADASLRVEVRQPDRKLVIERGAVRVWVSSPETIRYSVMADRRSLREIQEAAQRNDISFALAPNVDRSITLKLDGVSYWELMWALAVASNTRISGHGLVEDDQRERSFRVVGPYAVALVTRGSPLSLEVYTDGTQTGGGIPAKVSAKGVRADGKEEELRLTEADEVDPSGFSHCNRYLIDSQPGRYVRIKCTIVGYPLAKALHIAGPPGTSIDVPGEGLSVQIASVKEMTADLANDSTRCQVLSLKRPAGGHREAASVAGRVLPKALRVTNAAGLRLGQVQGVGDYDATEAKGKLIAYTLNPFGSLNPANWAMIEATLEIAGERTWTIDFSVE